MDSSLALLNVRNLRVQFHLSGKQTLTAVDDIDLKIMPGEVMGLVGESGSGKTVLSLSLLRLIDPPGRISQGEIWWQGANLLNLKPKEMRAIRGSEIAIIFQNPQSSLNPIYSVGSQMKSVILLHHRISAKEAHAEALRLLQLVKVPDPERRLSDFPHELSGGTCQRIMIAMALSCKPKLLIADEPTASLDVTIQAEIMDLLLEIRKELNTSILLVSHDLGVIARMCDRIAVMYLGRIVELAPSRELFRNPKHPYTKALLASVPIPDPDQDSQKQRFRITGEIPSPLNIPAGCRFRSRCPEVFDRCPNEDPLLEPVGENHEAACLLYKYPP